MKNKSLVIHFPMIKMEHIQTVQEILNKNTSNWYKPKMLRNLIFHRTIFKPFTKHNLKWAKNILLELHKFMEDGYVRFMNNDYKYWGFAIVNGELIECNFTTEITRSSLVYSGWAINTTTGDIAFVG